MHEQKTKSESKTFKFKKQSASYRVKKATIAIMMRDKKPWADKHGWHSWYAHKFFKNP